ncbi:MAG TPA: UDP-N-acetylmuramoyl-L-alanine--D-glutamate ligase [Abditibacteriaceae bacterium]|nr:UDP-N-acetylmuramoyl-L-alanine--D-glutamate ligase [Abditibacteriaceae bacterium]
MKPRIAVLLNLLADHLDYHPTLEQYWTTKLKLFANQDGSDIAIFNVDDDCVAGMMNEGGSELRGWLAGLCARVVQSSARDVALAEVPLRGAHNHSNLAAAVAAVTAALGEQAAECREQIEDAVRKFESLPHRLEIVGSVAGITWVNDSQATIPDAAVRALEAFAPPVTLIAGGRAKLENEDAFDELGQAIARHAQLLLTIGEAAPMIARAARRAGFESAKIMQSHTLTQAVIDAKMHTPDGGTVILSPACASFDQFKSFEARGELFRAAVAALEGSTSVPIGREQQQ